MQTPDTIVIERREYDCRATNLSWIPSVAERWRSVSTPSRSKRTLADFGGRFLQRVYTERERERYGSRISELAARFAAKEATSKALGTGIRGIRWREMEVLANRRGKPVLILHGSAAERAALLGLVSFDVSLTHSRTDAMAFVVGMKQAVATDVNSGIADSEGEFGSSERS